MLISYNWLKSYIPRIPEPEKVADLITFHICEMESTEKLPNGDFVFDLKILPDRAHDLLSHQGVARELAGLLGIEFKLPGYKVPESKSTDLKINIENPNCRRYMGRIVRNIKVGPSPEWVVKFLESVGQRSINNIVDATNIVMFDCGQPIHAFDLKQIPNKKIVVKSAKEGDKLELVGSDKIMATLKDTDMMITDGENNLAIAGVKGGTNSGIMNETKDLLIEVANFEPVGVRKTARRLGFQSDASKRYENNLSPELCDFAMKETTALILEMCPTAECEEIIDIYPTKQEVENISFSSDYIEKILGIKISDEEIEKILKNYNYEFTKSNGVWEITVPYMRSDITGPHDMAEEIGRVYGYDKIVGKVPKLDYKAEDNSTWTKICLAKRELIADGYREVMNYSFTDKGEVEIMASASDKNFLRTNLTDGLKESLKLNTLNAPLLGLNEIKLFEVGMVFTKKGEEMHVAFGNKKKVEEIELEKFIASSEDKFSGPRVGSPDTENLSSDFAQENKFKLWSVYPFITRDISVWVPSSFSADELKKIYQELGTELLVREPQLVDEFKKGDKTSYAFRLVFQSYDRTLTDTEINAIMTSIASKIVSLGYEVR